MKQARSTPQTSNRKHAGQTTVWVVVIIAVIVIVGIIWWSNRRTNTIQQQSTAQVNTLQSQIRGAEARARLSSLKANILAGQTAEQLDTQYQDIRTGLEEAYGNAQGAAGETWAAIQGDLGTLGDQISAGSNDAVATIDTIIGRLGQNQ